MFLPLNLHTFDQSIGGTILFSLELQLDQALQPNFFHLVRLFLTY